MDHRSQTSAPVAGTPCARPVEGVAVLMPKPLPCPTCGGPSSLAPENRWRPFCSERCRLIDLGAWMDGRYTIPGEPVPPETADSRLDQES